MQNYFATLLFSSECLSQPALPRSAVLVFAVTHRRLAGRGRARGSGAAWLMAVPCGAWLRLKQNACSLGTCFFSPWAAMCGWRCLPSPAQRPSHGHLIPWTSHATDIPPHGQHDHTTSCAGAFCCPTNRHDLMLLSDSEPP